MSKFTLSSEAINDLEVIWATICVILGEHPELGRARQFSQRALTGLRSFVITDFPNYVIFYRVKGEGVEIARVLHGARDIDAMFGCD